MNTYICIAGIICSLTTLVHLVLGQLDPVRPFLKCDLAEIPKATLLSCWHMVSFILIGSSILLLYIGWYNIVSMYDVVLVLSIAYISFSVIFIAIGYYYFKLGAFLSLPQWILLLPVGVLGGYGTM